MNGARKELDVVSVLCLDGGLIIYYNHIGMLLTA